MDTPPPERTLTQALGLSLASLPKAPEGAHARDRLPEKPTCVQCGQPARAVYVIEDDEHPHYGRRWVDLCPRHDYEFHRQTDAVDPALFEGSE